MPLALPESADTASGGQLAACLNEGISMSLRSFQAAISYPVFTEQDRTRLLILKGSTFCFLKVGKGEGAGVGTTGIVDDDVRVDLALRSERGVWRPGSAAPLGVPAAAAVVPPPPACLLECAAVGFGLEGFASLGVVLAVEVEPAAATAEALVATVAAQATRGRVVMTMRWLSAYFTTRGFWACCAERMKLIAADSCMYKGHTDVKGRNS
jgi:hypothetical protein